MQDWEPERLRGRYSLADAGSDPLLVFIARRRAWCAECARPLGPGRLIQPRTERIVVCLGCAGLADLVFLPRGDAAVTRRARELSPRWAVVMAGSHRRACRQGILVTTEALDRARAIAEHACLKRSGRVGRSAAAKRFAGYAVFAAVRAHVRHVHTRYEALLRACGRKPARRQVAGGIASVLARWRSGGQGLTA